MPFCLYADLELQYVLDAKKEQRKRMFFMAEEGRSRRKKTITMLKGREFKESFTVYLSPAGVKDKLTSLDVQVGLNLYIDATVQMFLHGPQGTPCSQRGRATLRHFNAV